MSTEMKFGCPRCAVDERLEGALYHPRLEKRKGLGEHVGFCPRCERTFLILEMPKRKDGKKVRDFVPGSIKDKEEPYED